MGVGSWRGSPQRQDKTEASTGGLRPAAEGEPAAQQTGPALGQGKPQADTAGRHVGRTAATEGTEDRPPLAGRHPGTAVLHLQDEPSAVLGTRPQPDARILD